MMTEATAREMIKRNDMLLSVPPDPLPWEAADGDRSVEVTAENRQYDYVEQKDEQEE